MRRASRKALTFEVLEGPEAVAALESEWTCLCARAPTHHVGQTFYWAHHAWVYSTRPGIRLRTLVGRQTGRLVLVWPLVVRGFGPWRIAHWLGVSFEYRDVLIEDNPAAPQWIEAAWRFVRAWLDVDLVRCPAVLPDAAIAPLLRGTRATVVWEETTQLLSLEQWPDWQSARHAMNAKARRELERCRRRLEERGSVSFRILNEPEQIEHTVGWLIASKRSWARRHGDLSPWLQSEDFARFLCGVVKDALAAGQLRFGVLELDGQVLAVLLAFVVGERMDLYVTSYDREWKTYAPGHLVFGEMINLAFEEKLRIVDFRFGLESYKRHYVTGQARAHGYVVPCSRWGAWYAAWLRSPPHKLFNRGLRALRTARAAPGQDQ